MFNLETDCRNCNSDHLSQVLDLGAQPLANHLRYPGGNASGLVPLELNQCLACQTTQITATVQPKTLFDNYFWVTGTSATARSYSKMFVDRTQMVLSGLDRTAGPQPGFVVEIASNDGTILRRFLEGGWRVLGVEPAGNIAAGAIAGEVPTLVEFFDAQVGLDLVHQYGIADVVVARNVVAHAANVHSVIEGMATVAGEGGVVVIEVHSAEVILSELHYDSIYHEHLFYFSLKTLSRLCEGHGLYPFDVFESPISGGSLVVFFSANRYAPSARLEKMTDRENRLGVNNRSRWATFAEAAIEHAAILKEVVDDFSRSRTVVGYGASARSSTMLNFAGITNGEVAVIVDQNELKQGRLTPGTDIPIVSPEVGLRQLGQSDALLLLAWNFEEEIVAQLRANGFRGDVIVPLPREVRVL